MGFCFKSDAEAKTDEYLCDISFKQGEPLPTSRKVAEEMGGWAGNYDGMHIEMTALCPVYGHVSEEDMHRFQKVGGQLHQVFRQSAIVSKRSLRQDSDQISRHRTKVAQQLIQSIKMHRAHGELAMGPLTGITCREGTDVWEIGKAQAQKMYSSLTKEP